MHNRGLCFPLQLIPYAVTLPETISIPAFQSFTLAILLFFAGQKIAEYWGVIRRYSIPEPVVGGFACALVVGLIYYTTGSKSILTGLADCLPERCFEERYMD